MSEIGAGGAMIDALTLLAQAQALDDAHEQALSTIESALRQNPEERVTRLQTLINRGDLRLESGQAALAEEDFRNVMEQAGEIGARSLELRSSASLARLLLQRGDTTGSRDLLSKICSRFPSDQHTPDLDHARDLLKEVS